MACNSCGSVKQGEFTSEIDIHFPGLGNVKKKPVVVFPELLVCLNCGKAELTNLLFKPHDGFLERFLGFASNLLPLVLPLLIE
jgi:hypothetical protein